MSRQHSKALWQFLQAHGFTETDETIQQGKKLYRKLYQRDYKRFQRAVKSEYTVVLSHDENKLISKAASQHTMSPTRFIKQSCLAYLNQQFLVLHIEQVCQIEYALMDCLNVLRKIATNNKDFDSRFLEQTIKALDRRVKRSLRNPLVVHSDTSNA